MKRILAAVALFLALNVGALDQPLKPATQAQTDAGTLGSVAVTPKTLAGRLGALSLTNSSDIRGGTITSNQFLFFELAARNEVGAAQTPPMRFISWYSGYGGGGVSAASSNNIYQAAWDTTNAGLQKYGEIVIEMDDGWGTNARSATGQLIPSTNFFGANPILGMTQLINSVHAMSPNLLFGQYYEINANGQTSAGFVGTDPAHIRQDATNAANWGVDYIKLDSPDTTFTFQQKMYQVAEFTYWYKKTAAALGHRAIIKTDMAGPAWGPITWSNSDALLFAKLVDVWNPCSELVGSANGLAEYTRFLTNFDQNFLPYYKATVSQGHWMDLEGPVFAYCAAQCGVANTNVLAGELTIDAVEAMFNIPFHYGAVANSDYWFIQTNASLIALNQEFTEKPRLVYQSSALLTNVQVWARRLDWPRVAVLFWNRQYSNNATVTVSSATLGVGTGATKNSELVWSTNYLWTNSLTVTLPPAGAHLVIMEPAGFVSDTVAQSMIQNVTLAPGDVQIEQATIGVTPSPLFVDYAFPFTAANDAFSFQVPSWITQAVAVVSWQYSGPGTLRITNRVRDVYYFNSDRVFGAGSVDQANTLTNDITRVAYSFFWPVTNSPKIARISLPVSNTNSAKAWFLKADVQLQGTP